jgi:hypothetical protein
MSVARVTHPLVYDLDEASAKLGKSERWLADKLRARRFPGRKVGRTWKLTQDDLDEIIQLCAIARQPASPVDSAVYAVPQTSSITRTSARRMQLGVPVMPA